MISPSDWKKNALNHFYTMLQNSLIAENKKKYCRNLHFENQNLKMPFLEIDTFQFIYFFNLICCSFEVEYVEILLL